ncbi:hypothetical protein [Hymenobacter terrenus]|uniref:hypothetical protein n=1 Tax=Hymenobacter terrenus TaxID=1629124 RepID=UPI0006190477|nr:hypothetical protein [Hymenobacter terrenus]
MKHLLPLAPILFCLAACQSNPKSDAAAPQPARQEPAKVQPVKPELDTSEHIELSMVTINGQPWVQQTTKQLKNQLGRPDSIAKGAVECGSQLDIPMNSPDGDFWYYGKTMYEVNGSQAMLYKFNVTSGKFQGKIGKLVLDKNTTLEDVRRFFPESAKQAETPAIGRPGEVMNLPFYYKGEQVDTYLNLIFQKGRLQEVEFWSPC